MKNLSLWIKIWYFFKRPFDLIYYGWYKWVNFDESNKKIIPKKLFPIYTIHSNSLLQEVSKKINEIVGFTLINSIPEKYYNEDQFTNNAIIFIEFKDDLGLNDNGDRIDGRAFPFPEGKNKSIILLRNNLKDHALQKIYAHELIHMLGHWGHGTSYLMQPIIPSSFLYDELLHGTAGWLVENYGK